MNIYTIVKTTYNTDEDMNAIYDSILTVELLGSYDSMRDASFEWKQLKDSRTQSECYYIEYEVVKTNLY